MRYFRLIIDIILAVRHFVNDESKGAEKFLVMVRSQVWSDVNRVGNRSWPCCNIFRILLQEYRFHNLPGKNFQCL